MATIYARNETTNEWEKVGPAANATDSTLTLQGSPADAKATGDAINNIQTQIDNMSFDGSDIDVSEQINTSISNHNTSNTAHADIREQISQLSSEKANKTYVDTEIAKLEQATPKFVETIEECTDPSKMYVLPDGYIYAYMIKQEEIVTPGETITTPAKAVIIHGQRYSYSGKAWGEKEGCATLVIPVEFENAVTSSNKVELWLTNMMRHASYTGAYYGTDVTQFTVEAVQTALQQNYYGSTIYNIPAGKGFLCVFLRTSTTDGSDFANVSFTFDGQTFVPELYFSSADASNAVHGSTTTSEGTTEIIDNSGFYSTGLTYSGGDYDDEIAELRSAIENISAKAVVKGNSIIINNDIHTLTSSVSLTIPQLKKNKTIAFSGIYTGTLSEFSIIQGEGTGFTECKCIVTATTITISKNGITVYTAEHGLTFGTHFSLVLATKNLNKTKAYLVSGGKTFTSSEFVWDTARRNLNLYTDTPFTVYQFAFGSDDFDKKIWMYGDSYFGHWMNAGVNRGYTNCLVDGYSGGGSSAGLASLRISLEHGLPEKIVWCLGMNDGDKGAINQNWLAAITAVKEICDQNGIELWVSTIPNVPTVDNTYKNAYIRANFENIVDVSKFVGADESTSWYTGLLSSDGVHPSSSAGDFYIANVMETYFPELLDA